MSRNKPQVVSNDPLLFQEFDALRHGISDQLFSARVSTIIKENLRWPLRKYQIEALGRFDYYLKEYPHRKEPINLLFNMATGSGKTLLMAANMLQLYLRGYRNFLFFVNNTNIVDKTRQNFLNPNVSKYLFADPIKIDGNTVRIREVSNFSEANENDINIVFTTIQGLHVQLNSPRENALTYQEIFDRDVVLISDETHHLNALTKIKGTAQERIADIEDALAGFDVGSLNQDEETAIRSWEGTVKKIMETNQKNILLEYTATLDEANINVVEKYRDKILMKYDLRAYCHDRYSKDIDIVQADLLPIDRAIQAIIVSQYKRKVAEAHKLDIKPVVLFKANRIKLENLKKRKTEDVGSEEFYKEFSQRISTLTEADLLTIRDNVDPKSIVKRAFDFFKQRGVELSALADELRLDFSPERCLSVNEESELIEWQLKVNTLEDHNNEIRAIFAVERLNEGWDVLNLFDIVRLYNTRDARANRPGKKTVSEAQLIGRGARYCPFSLNFEKVNYEQEKDRRKFDEDPENELRILEQLHYHSAHNTEYIQELRKALEQIGINLLKAKECPITVKDAFKKTNFWNHGLVYVNAKEKINHKTIIGITKNICEANYKAKIFSGIMSETSVFGQMEELRTSQDLVTANLKITDFSISAVRRALDQLPFFVFSNLKKFFPNLRSMKQFMSDKFYLGCVAIETTGPKELVDKPNPDDQVQITRAVLQQMQELIEKGWTEFYGTKKFVPKKIKSLIKDINVLHIVKDEATDQERGIAISETQNDELRIDLRQKDWYVFDENYGTSEEKKLIKFIDSKMVDLKQKYTDICLFRNEKEVKLFRFSDGKATEPDFILFLTERSTGNSKGYQIFIESKGAHLIEHDQWKEDFLLNIEKEAQFDVVLENHEYRIIGLPFFTSARGRAASFESVFGERFLKKSK